MPRLSPRVARVALKRRDWSQPAVPWLTNLRRIPVHYHIALNRKNCYPIIPRCKLNRWRLTKQWQRNWPGDWRSCLLCSVLSRQSVFCHPLTPKLIVFFGIYNPGKSTQLLLLYSIWSDVRMYWRNGNTGYLHDAVWHPDGKLVDGNWWFDMVC